MSVAPLQGQGVPPPVQPLTTRKVHPCIANPSSAVLNGASPAFQYADQAWNHGEGFVAGGADTDRGAWHIPESSGPVVDELIVTTLAGDVIVMNATTLTEIWRTHVPGSAGFFNSIRVADLDGDQVKELYVAGSFGFWRFTQPGESSP